MLELSNLCHCVYHPKNLTSRNFWGSSNEESHFLCKNVFWENGRHFWSSKKRKLLSKHKCVLRKCSGVSQKQCMMELSNLCYCVQLCWKLTSRNFWSSRNERKPLYKQKCVLRKYWWMLDLAKLFHCVQHSLKLTNRDFWSSRNERKTLSTINCVHEKMIWGISETMNARAFKPLQLCSSALRTY